MIRTLVWVGEDKTNKIIHLDGFQTHREELLAQLFDIEPDLLSVTFRWSGSKTQRNPDERYIRGA